MKKSASKESVAELDDAKLVALVDNIWKKYDTDGNGVLDKEEVRQFVADFVGSSGASGAKAEQQADDAFDEVFKAFDEDNSGSVDKEEVTAFIKKLLDPSSGSNKRKSSINGKHMKFDLTLFA